MVKQFPEFKKGAAFHQNVGSYLRGNAALKTSNLASSKMVILHCPCI